MSPNAVVDDPILWHEGMLLTPQHFQQHDIHFQLQLRHQMEQLQPYFWGLMELQYSAARLQEGTLHIERLRAVLPDGLVVCTDEEASQVPGGPTPLSLDLTEEPLLLSKGRVRVYLTVPLRAAGSASDQASVRRFDSWQGPASVDENTGEDPLSVLRLRPRVTLVAGLAPPKNAVAMPLLEIRREASGQLVLSPYHPPLLQLGASGFLAARSLQEHLEKLLDKLRRKVVRLAQLKGNRSQNLYALTAALPQLEVLVHARCSHPFAVYQALAALVGHASALHPEGVPPLLAPYHHEQILSGFVQGIRYLDDLVEGLELEYEVLAFKQEEPDAFSLMIPQQWSGGPLTIELKGAEGQDTTLLGQWLQEARIGSANLHAQLVDQRSPGAWTERLTPAVGSGFTSRAGAVLFYLKSHDLRGAGAGQPVLSAGQPLLIRGAGRLPPPGRILMYVRRLQADDLEESS